MRHAVVVISLALLRATPVVAQSAASLNPATRAFVSVDAPVVALTHVQLIDGTGALPAADQTVVIDNGRIAWVGSAASARVPAGAQVMDLTGHTVIPGMFGLHDHTFYTTAAGRRAQLSVSAPRLYLASGVTSVRTTGSISPYSELTLKGQVDRGEAPGPRLTTTGPYITGPDAVMERAHVSTPEDARRVVRYWAEEGVTWFKFYTGISHREAAAAIDEAHKLGVKVTGHLCSIGFREAVALGIDGLEHGFRTNSEWDPEKKPDQCPPRMLENLAKLDINSEAVQATIRDIVAHRVPITSTLVVSELSVPNRPPIEQRMLDAMLPEVRGEYLTSRARIADGAASSIAGVLLKKEMEFERAFVKAGGLLAAGVDPTGNGGALPGFGDQRNYELFLEAGFAPAEAVQILTANGAKVLGHFERLGTVSVGKLADLVVIRGDPVARPAEFKRVTVVFKDGVGYDSEKLIGSVRGLVGLR